MSQVIIDVRERDEFEAEHVENSINVPLSHFASVAPGVLNQLQEKNILLLCRNGTRAQFAAQQIGQLGFADKATAVVFDGGILEWKKQGKPVIKTKGVHIPIFRQVQIVVGPLIFASTLLGAFINPRFLFVSGFFGLGLTVAGTTGFCGMAKILGLMPWNKSSSSRIESCR